MWTAKRQVTAKQSPTAPLGSWRNPKIWISTNYVPFSGPHPRKPNPRET